MYYSVSLDNLNTSVTPLSLYTESLLRFSFSRFLSLNYPCSYKQTSEKILKCNQKLRYQSKKKNLKDPWLRANLFVRRSIFGSIFSTAVRTPLIFSAPGYSTHTTPANNCSGTLFCSRHSSVGKQSRKNFNSRTSKKNFEQRNRPDRVIICLNKITHTWSRSLNQVLTVAHRKFRFRHATADYTC